MLMAGGLTAAWYFAPDDLNKLTAESPNVTKLADPLPQQKKVELTKAQQARALMEKNDFAQALKQLDVHIIR